MAIYNTHISSQANKTRYWAVKLKAVAIPAKRKYLTTNKIILSHISLRFLLGFRGLCNEKAFDPERARSLVRRIKFYYTPKHGSWLNIAKNELSAMTRQCLSNRRIGNIETLQREISAWSPCVREVVAYSENHLRGPEGDGNGVFPSSSRTGFANGVDEREKPTADSCRNRCGTIHDSKMAA
jgi:hypothetical protein